MSGALFDVVVTGAADPSADAQRRLVSALAGQLGLPVAGVARGLAGRSLLAARALDKAAAEGLGRDLQRLGATVTVRPAIAGPSSMVGPAPAGLGLTGGGGGLRPPTLVGGGSKPPARDSFAPTPAPLGSPAGRDPFAPAPLSGAVGSPASNAKGGDPFAPPPSGPGLQLNVGSATGRNPFAPAPASQGRRAGAAPAERDPFAPPSSPGLDLLPPPAPAPAPLPAVPDTAPPLELDIGPSTTSSAQSLRTEAASLAGASGLTIATVNATSSESGLAVNQESASEAYRIRCPAHGLFFDKRKASGCRKCLDPGRQIADTLERQSQPFKLLDLADQPAKRAFIGLALALILGLFPASYHALRVGAGELRQLRAEQEVLSEKPATDENLKQFELLEIDVRRTHRSALRNTALLWLLVTSGAMAGWYRLT